MQLHAGGQKSRNLRSSVQMCQGHSESWKFSLRKELPASELCHHHSCQLDILTQEPCTRLQRKSASEESYEAQLTEQIEGFSRGSNLYSWAGWAKSRRGPATEIVVLLASRFTMFLSTNGLWNDQFDTVNARSNVKHVRRNESDTQSYLYIYRYYIHSWYDFIHK